MVFSTVSRGNENPFANGHSFKLVVRAASRYSRGVANFIPNFKTGPSPAGAGWWRSALMFLIRLALAGVLMGWLYVWGAPLIYRPQSAPGFWLGCAHGALMPMALPSLLMQKDVPIYAAVNQGRNYKIGYIAGINGCGFVVFGMLFWKPQRRSKF
jgi:hypothetical protein